jgi:TfoX/Sxy family transcriptional regulator of competence genes
MPYDRALAGRVRRALEGRTDVVEKAMFGGLTFMVCGNMCCGVNRDDLIIRLDARTRTEGLNSPHARAWDFMPSRPMPGMFAISAEGSADQRTVDQWVRFALKHATSLPPKVKGAKSKPASRGKPPTTRGRGAK